jgi:hypothetical protein
MDWTTLSAIASLVGVIGGLVSVVFLVLEIRRNAKAIEGATVQGLMQMEAQVFTWLADHAELFLKGGADFAALTPVEAFRYTQAVKLYMSLFYAAFKQYEEQLTDPEVWHAYEDSLRTNLARPGFAACWQGFQGSYPTSFRAHLATLSA